MKILVLTIAVFTLNAYVTNATSLDPTQYVEMGDAKSESGETRTKRSGDIFSSLLKKKFGLISSIAGSSSGKSIGHSEHYEEPLSYNTKSFNLWGVKKAIMGSVLQAAKAITGGVIALKGQLIKAKGHVVVAKGKLMQTKGEAISNFGKTIATHAFDSHQEPQIDVYNHLPVTPIHHPTSYGTATGLGYQGQIFPSNGFQNHAYPSHGFPLNSYPVAAQSFPTGFAVPSTAYGTGIGVGTGYGVYGGGGNGFTAKRAVQQDSFKVTNQNTKSLVDKDSVQAGLLIFKPIKMGQNQNLPSGGGGGLTSQSVDGVLQNFNQQHFKPQLGNGFNGPADFKGSAFPAYQGAFNNGYAGQQQLQLHQHQPGGGYPSFQDPSAGYAAPNGGYPAAAATAAAFQFPTGSGGASEGFETFPAAAGQTAYGLQNFGFPQPANSQEFNRQLAAFSGHASYPSSLEAGGGGANDGSDQHDSASNSEEHLAQPSDKSTRHVRAQQHPKRQHGASTSAVDHFLPTTARYDDDVDGGAGAGSAEVSDRGGAAPRAGKRSVPRTDDAAASGPPAAGIAPLEYHHDGSSAEDQARLKKTVQRFFSMLQKQPFLPAD